MSDMQKQILALHSEGLINRRIAEEVGCSPTYVTHTLTKCGIRRNRIDPSNPDQVRLTKLKHKALDSTDKAISRARMGFATLYEMTGDETALDAIDLICGLEGYMAAIRAGNTKMRRAA